MFAFSFKDFCTLLNLDIPEQNCMLTGVSVDTRLIEPGHAFFALTGEKVDGHDFLEEAANKKAAVLVILDSYEGKLPQIPIIRVEDTLQSLQECAKAYLKTWDPLVVALTGSNGKTTTKDFLKILLSKKYKVGGTYASYNGQIGLPLSILNARGDEQLLVLEMAMTLPGQIERLVAIAEPDVSLITNVHLAHACSFKSIDEIAMAKSEIFLHDHTRIGFMQSEIPMYECVMKVGICEKATFSIKDPKADFYLDCENFPYNLYDHGEKKLTVDLPLKGLFNAENFLAAAVVAHDMGVEWEDIAEGVKELKAAPNRFEEIHKNGVIFFDDTYNASSPTAVCAALRALPTPEKGGRKVAVLSEMLELGDFSDKGHEEVATCALEKVETLICYGEQCRIIADIWKKNGREVDIYFSREELIKAIRETIAAKDVVLLKSNRACAWEDLVEEI